MKTKPTSASPLIRRAISAGSTLPEAAELLDALVALADALELPLAPLSPPVAIEAMPPVAVLAATVPTEVEVPFADPAPVKRLEPFVPKSENSATVAPIPSSVRHPSIVNVKYWPE